MNRPRKQDGFSLLELILVIVLLGVLASGAGLLITKPIEAYNDQLRRQQLVDQGEMALRQIARDVRRALPNSIRVTPTKDAVEMVNTVAGARYRDEVGGVYTDPLDWLDFSMTDASFNMLGLLPIDPLEASHRLVIYNTAPANIYADIADTVTPYEGIVTPEITTTSPSFSLGLSLENEEHRITMTPNFLFTQQSPGQRVFVIDGPVSYICNPAANSITRYGSYDYQSSQPTLAAPPGLPLSPNDPRIVVNSLDSCSIEYAAGTTQRSGLVSITMVLNDPAAPDERITLFHQIHVVNVP